MTSLGSADSLGNYIFKGLFTWREEDPSTWKILEGETNFRLIYMQKILVGVVAGNRINLSVFSSWTPGRRHICFSALSTGIFWAKVVYMVLGSSYLSARKILALERS